MAVTDQALQYLGEHTVMSIATTGTNGLWNTAVFYAHDGTELYFISKPDSRHCRNIALHSDVVVTIQENYTDWKSIRGIQAEGAAVQLQGEKLDRAMKRYLNKFSFLTQAGADPQLQAVNAALDNAAWYCISLRRLFYLDNEQGFGHRVEVPLP